MFSIYVKKYKKQLFHQKIMAFSKCEVLNCHSFLCCINTFILQAWYTDFPHQPPFLHVSDLHRVTLAAIPMLSKCICPVIPWAVWPGRKVGRAVLPPTPQKYREPRASPHATSSCNRTTWAIEPRQPSQFTGFIWFRLTWVVFPMISQSTGSKISHQIQPMSQSKPKDVKSKASCQTVTKFWAWKNCVLRQVMSDCCYINIYYIKVQNA